MGKIHQRACGLCYKIMILCGMNEWMNEWMNDIEDYVYLFISISQGTFLTEHRREMYSRITSTKSPSFCMTISACLINLTAPPFWLQKHTDLRAHDLAHSPDLRHQLRLAEVRCVWSWRLCGINPAIRDVTLSTVVQFLEQFKITLQ